MELSPSEIVSEYAGFVWRALVHLGVSDNQLKDVSQEVFLVATRKLPDFEGRSSVRTWLYGICRNLAADARRRDARNPETPGELPESIVMPAQEGALWAKRAHAQLVRALGTLDDAPRLVFILFEIEQLSMDEIAEERLGPRFALATRDCKSHATACAPS